VIRAGAVPTADEADEYPVDDPVIEVRDLSFSYDDMRVLEDVNFTISRLDFTGIVGPNGGGKTTLLKLLLGLLRPDRGSVRVFGLPPAQAAARVGYVPQSLQYDPRLPVTVADVVLMGHLGHTHPFGASLSESRDEVREALAAVDLPDFEARRFADLSGGQQQRVLIARALATQPEMLMLDEPTAGLDAASERDILGLLQRLNAKMTVVLVTHDLGFVSSAVKSVLCVNRQVLRHPTTEVCQITGDVLGRMYGNDFKVVRHDQSYREGGGNG